MIDRAAEAIHRRKMEMPAILALEMHKPLSFVGSQAALVFSPFLVPIFGYDKVNDFSRLFSKRENIERLLDRLDRLRTEKPEASE